MLEIYNDQLRDLLVDVRRANDLKLVDGVVNTRSVEVHNTMDVLKVGARGLCSANRTN
jgi:3-deoxy-D-arabino-heptulosonate 7-phosphate (DAHP) synthase